MPRMDPKEVAAVFTAPFHNFLRQADEVLPGQEDARSSLPDGDWYDGEWLNWHETPWRIHNFYVPVNNQRIAKPRVRDGGLAALSEEEEAEEESIGRYKVWGMTARILVDAATVAYGERPEFEHNAHFGDEKLIEVLEKMGRLTAKKKAGSVITEKDVAEAAEKASKM